MTTKEESKLIPKEVWDSFIKKYWNEVYFKDFDVKSIKKYLGNHIYVPLPKDVTNKEEMEAWKKEMKAFVEAGYAFVEKDYYEVIKTKVEDFIKTNFNIDFHLEITANKTFSNKLKAEISPRGERDIVYNFLRDARPDISGFIKNEYNSDLIAIEIKNKELEVGDIYQTKRYAELLSAKYALLISTKEIPIEIKRLSSKVYPLLSSGYSGERITLIHFEGV